MTVFHVAKRELKALALSPQTFAIGAAYSVPASIFRAYGGVLSDRMGARTILYWTFAVSAVCCAILSLPAADYAVRGVQGPIAFHFEIGPIGFVVVIFVLGEARPMSTTMAGDGEGAGR